MYVHSHLLLGSICSSSWQLSSSVWSMDEVAAVIDEPNVSSIPQSHQHSLLSKRFKEEHYCAYVFLNRYTYFCESINCKLSKKNKNKTKQNKTNQQFIIKGILAIKTCPMPIRFLSPLPSSPPPPTPHPPPPLCPNYGYVSSILDCGLPNPH